MSSYSSSVATSSDNRVQLDSTGGGKFVAPQAVSSDPGSIALSAGDYSNTNFSVENLKLGMSGAEVTSLLNQQGSLATEQLASVAEFGQAAISAVQSNKATELATASGEPTWSKYIPLLIGGALLVMFWRKA